VEEDAIELAEDERPVSFVGEASACIGLGLAALVGYTLLHVEAESLAWKDPDLFSILDKAIVWTGFVFFVLGGLFYAKHKGHSGWLGAFLGCWNILGLIILLCMPNKRSRNQHTASKFE